MLIFVLHNYLTTEKRRSREKKILTLTKIMNKWLLKTEPTVYSYSDLEKVKKTTWDGVSSPGGLSNIRKTKKGDLAFIYHTGDEKQVVGIAEIISDPYPDPKASNPRLFVFDIKPKQMLKKPVTLIQVKADKRFKDSKLVNEPRLSVQPMPDELWDAVLEMAK
jgi:predicted RNA-binding protein with PUA-like domain